jgi:UDP-N-acetylglucosamine 4,6-dehydratase (inverting)
MFKNKSIFVTGATGSFGKAFVAHLIKNHPNFKRLVIFSRDELKQFEMSKLKKFQHKNLRMFLGDIREKDRLESALEGIDIVIHAAALKQVPAAEYNPFEFIKTNVIGTQNLVETCIKKNVKKVVALSTDKASSPINLYGATKLCADKLVLSANNIKGAKKISFSVVRYGNVMGSRGSVVPFFLDMYKNKKKLPLTHFDMTRFNISLKESIELVEKAIKYGTGGEIFVPKLKSFYIRDLIKVITKKVNHFNIVGIRPGEKIHEELISSAELKDTISSKDHFVVLSNSTTKQIMEYCKGKNYKKVNNDFTYNSGTNKNFLSLKELKKIVDAYSAK